jgi:hypothetical protein
VDSHFLNFKVKIEKSLKFYGLKLHFPHFIIISLSHTHTHITKSGKTENIINIDQMSTYTLTIRSRTRNILFGGRKDANTQHNNKGNDDAT